MPQIKPQPQRREEKRSAPNREEIRKKASAKMDPMRREKERLAREEAAQMRELRRMRRKKLFLLSFCLSLVFVLLFYGASSLRIALRPDGTEDGLPLLVYTLGEREADRKFAAEEVTFAGGIYLPVTLLEDYMAIIQYGDHATRSFLLPESGQYATFFLGTGIADINGERVFLKGNSFMKDEVLYLPVDFFEDKMNCFDYTHSSALASEVLTFLDNVKPALRFSPATATPSVDYSTVPVIPSVPETPTVPEVPPATP